EFAGAQNTYGIEIVMPDGKALQAATSHNLGDNFSKVFGISFSDEKGKTKPVFQTSWGLSTRSLAALIMVHGDDAGLVMPPLLAPIQVMIMAIGKADDPQFKEVVAASQALAGELKNHGILAEVNADQTQSLGYRINEQEVQGFPLRLEVGAKELDKGVIKFARRDTFEKGDIKKGEIVEEVRKLLEQIQANLFEKSKKQQAELTIAVRNYDEFKDVMAQNRRFIEVFWCEDSECEAKVKEETKATPRVCELKNLDQKADKKCFHCGKDANREWLFAQSY
ncbi:MAG TPA: His/Gly/Thr/Pro-type tRNA ligase C-terminal domain-containing protein, partial [Candidatus Saccharimonadales bacterium]|nr:His/Gly/Thr/Pro-type tRNA ligase C-terminal domain-containing protein [Candidatus Saccharimonadales bacterium]